MVDSTFQSFLQKFDTINLPFSIQNRDDFSKFIDTVYAIDKGVGRYIPNPNFKTITKEDISNFLQVKYSNLDSHYLYAYRYSNDNFYLVIIKQSNYNTEEYWLKLNLFSKHGILLDTLTIAGLKTDCYDVYCRIDTNNTINTLTLFEPSQWDSISDTYSTLKTNAQFIVTKDGHFDKIKSKKYFGRFKVENDKIIDIEE